MAKKKSKGFIVPSINFITMHRPAQSVETATVTPEVKMPEETIEADKNQEEEAVVQEHLIQRPRRKKEPPRQQLLNP